MALYAFSLSWAFFLTYLLGYWSTPHEPIQAWRMVIYMIPAVVAGIATGRRVWPAYFYAVLIVAAPMMLFRWDPLIAVVLVSAAILTLGYLGQAAWCVVTRRRRRDMCRREADAPGGVGGASTASGGVAWKRPATIASSSPTGDEMPKRRTW